MCKTNFANLKYFYLGVFILLLGSFNFIGVTSAESLLENGSFESGLNGWETNSSDAISVKFDEWSAPGGGNYRLDYNLYDSKSLVAETYQKVVGLENGDYILSAYVANSGSFNESYMYAKVGEEIFKADIPVSGEWSLVELPIDLNGEEVIVGFLANTQEGAWLGIDVVTLKVADDSSEKPTPETGEFIKGIDISSLTKVEDNGGKFYDNGEEKDPLEIFTDYGANYARLVIWKDPYESDDYNNLEDTIRKAKRIKESGMKLLLNFHYSDTWADPGNQDIPAAWEDYTFDELVQAVYDHTEETLTALADEGIIPDMVQVGNEIRPGMLFPYGKIELNGFGNLAKLLNSGIKAVRDAEGGADIDIMLHLDQGGDNGAFKWWFDGVIDEGVTDFQVIGASYYPYWHGTLEDLAFNLNDISDRYDKDVIVVETAYGFTLDDADGHGNIFNRELEQKGGYPATEEGQAKFLYDLLEVIKNVPNDRGIGFFYWEPAWLGVKGAGWISGEGNAWENQAMFDFNGNALESLNIFTEGYVAPEPEPRPEEPEVEDPSLKELTLHSLNKPTSASSSAGDGGGKNNLPENAVDGDEYTSWGTDEGVGAWWEVDLESISSINRLLFNFWDGVQEVEIKISDDGIKYKSLGLFTVTDNKMDYSLSEYTAARYIKVIITEATSNWVGFMEFSAYGDEEITEPDLVAPITEAIIKGELVNGEYLDEVKISLSAIDNNSGVDRIEYSFNQGDTWLIYEDVITVNSPGKHELLYRSIDNAGNIEEVNELSFIIVKKDPDNERENNTEPPTVENNNDQGKEQDDTEKSKGTDKVEDTDKAPLPKTATNLFNFILIGVILLGIGAAIYYSQIRKRRAL